MYIHIHSQGPAVSPKCNHSPPTPAALSLSECGIECFRASFRKEMQKRVWKNKPTGDIFWAKFSPRVSGLQLYHDKPLVSREGKNGSNSRVPLKGSIGFIKRDL